MMNDDFKWQAHLPTTATPYLEWLLHRGSFIDRLKNYGIVYPEIILLKQTWERPLISEYDVLKLATREFVLVREVLIKSIEGNWMVARTVIPRKTLSGKEKRLHYLKNHSLGSVLFKYPYLERSEYEFASLMPGELWYGKISRCISVEKEILSARRSLFTLKRKTILLSEIFLPDLLNL